MIGYGREAPLTPQQVLELAKASLKPDPKTLGVHGQGRSGSTMSLSESGEEEVEELEVQPANFLPMGEGEFLPFVDRPKEVRLLCIFSLCYYLFSYCKYPNVKTTLSR